MPNGIRNQSTSRLLKSKIFLFQCTRLVFKFIFFLFRITYVFHLRIFDILLRNNLTYPFSKIAQREKAALKVLHNFTTGVIVRRRKDLLAEKATEDQSTIDNFGVKHKMALLDVLLQSTVDGVPLTNAEILEEVDTFMFEGHDTTTSGITFALYCIAQKPEVQRKILREIHEVIGKDKSTPVTLNMLNKLQYLEMAIKEALRLYPSVPMIGRGIDQDTVISKGFNCNLFSF